MIFRTQNENNPLFYFGKIPRLILIPLYYFKTCGGNQALYGILGSTCRNESKKHVRHYYGKKEKSKTGEISCLGLDKWESHGHFVMQTIMQ